MLINKTGYRRFTSPQQEETAYFWCTNLPDKILRTSRLSQAVCDHTNIPHLMASEDIPVQNHVSSLRDRGQWGGGGGVA